MKGVHRSTIIWNFDNSPSSAYFEYAVDLLKDEYPYEVILIYMFAVLEKAQRDCLVWGAMKIHNVSGTPTRSAVNKLALTRDDFRRLFRTVIGEAIPDDMIDLIKRAEKIRDKVMHGARCTEGEKKQALMDTLKYFESFENLYYSKTNIHLSKGATGFKGRKESLDNKTTRWMLIGMGFIKPQN